LGAKPLDTFRVGGWERKGLDSSQRISPFAGENPNLRGVSKRGASPSSNILPLMIGIHIHILERGIKGVPRKIEDFSGCIKGVR